MHRRIRKHLLLVVIVVGVTAGAWGVNPGSARAYHTYKTRLLDTTAYSLHRREARVGLMKVSYGILDQLQISTYTIPWFLGLILESVAPNLEVKSTFYDHKRLALSASMGVIFGTVAQIETGLGPGDPGAPIPTTEVTYSIVPVGLASSVRINPWVSMHLGGQFTWTETLGDSEPADSEVRGMAVLNLLQLYGMVEWRVSRVTALTLTVRWLPYVSDVVVQSNVIIDPNTGLIIGIEVNVEDLTNAFAVVPGFVFSWDRANLRMGVGYGDFFVESVGGLVIPGSTLSNISAELDVFIRF